MSPPTLSTPLKARASRGTAWRRPRSEEHAAPACSGGGVPTPASRDLLDAQSQDLLVEARAAPGDVRAGRTVAMDILDLDRVRPASDQLDFPPDFPATVVGLV